MNPVAYACLAYCICNAAQGGLLHAQAANKGSQERQRAGCIVEGIVPGFAGNQGGNVGRDTEGIAHGAEGVVGQGGQRFASQRKSIQPGAEPVAGECAEETLLGGGVMPQHQAVGQQAAQVAPELAEGRRLVQHIGGNAVYLGGTPAYRAVAGDVGSEDFFLAKVGDVRDFKLAGFLKE